MYRPISPKLRAARALAAELKFTDAQQMLSGVLYQALRDAGYVWHKRTGWQLAPDGDFTGGRSEIPADTVRVRLTGESSDVEAFTAWLSQACAAAGIEMSDPSRPYRNAKGDGVRVYLSVRTEAIGKKELSCKMWFRTPVTGDDPETLARLDALRNEASALLEAGEMLVCTCKITSRRYGGMGFVQYVARVKWLFNESPDSLIWQHDNYAPSDLTFLHLHNGDESQSPAGAVMRLENLLAFLKWRAARA